MNRPDASWFLAALGLLVVLSLFTTALRYSVLEHVAVTGINYDARAAGDPAFRVRRIVPRTQSNTNDLAISLAFRPFPSQSFGELFQTAPLNEGVRAEISAHGDFAIIAHTRTPPGIKVYLLSHGIVPGVWHDLAITITRDHRIRIDLDHLPVVNAPDIELKYRVSDIVFGAGFSSGRTFQGEIRDGRIEFTNYAENPIAVSPLWTAVKGFLLLAMVWLLYRLSDPALTSSRSAPWASIQDGLLIDEHLP